MQQVNVRIKRVDPRAILPRIAKPGDVCADLHALDEGTVPARGRAFIRTGIALELPEGYRARIHSRSGLSCNGILAAPGVIDNGYRGEVGIVLLNHGETAFRYRAGDRVAQLAIERYWEPVFVEVDDLSETERGVTGFGSSGLGVSAVRKCERCEVKPAMEYFAHCLSCRIKTLSEQASTNGDGTGQHVEGVRG